MNFGVDRKSSGVVPAKTFACLKPQFLRRMFMPLPSLGEAAEKKTLPLVAGGVFFWLKENPQLGWGFPKTYSYA